MSEARLDERRSMINPRGEWGEDRIERLKKLWREGLTASQISECFGGAVSRSAVIGKASRLKLSSRKKPKKLARITKPRAPKAKKPPQRSINTRSWQPSPAPLPGNPMVAKGPAWDALEGTQPVELMDLERHHCRWPIGDTKPYLFCGQQAEEGSSYCPTHRARSTGKGSSWEQQAIGAAKAIGNDEVRNGASTFAARDVAAELGNG